MPIKFEDETPTKSTIKFDDDVSKISIGGEKTPPSRGEILSDIPKGAVSNLESLARGAVAGIPATVGIPGTLSVLGQKGINIGSQALGGDKVFDEKTRLPEAGPIFEKTLRMMPRLTPERKESKGMEELGSIATPGPKMVVGATKKAITLPEALGTKMGDISAVIRGPKPVGSPEGFYALGEKVESGLKGEKGNILRARKEEANTLYSEAKDVAREKQVLGQPFAPSPQGQQLLRELEAEKYFKKDGQTFLKGEEQRKGVDRLIDAVKGVTTGGETVPVGKGKITGQMTRKTPTKTTEKDIDAVIEELRYLREVNKPGKEFDAYAGLEARYRKGLADKLEQYLYSWNPEYEVADKAYKNASSKLAPFETGLMRRILAKEKFLPGELARDTESFAKDFFKSTDTVKNLKEATGDPVFVRDLAKDYVATIFSNKEPKQIQAFVRDPANQGWLQESGILPNVQQYANQATTRQNFKDIAKVLGMGAAAGAIGYPLARGIGSSLGF